MAKLHYVCEGTCHADISEERYLAGLTRCGADGCSMEGKPFKKCVDEKPHSHIQMPRRSK